MGDSHDPQFSTQRQKQTLITRLTGATDVAHDDQRIGCSICGFPGHTARNCYNLVKVSRKNVGDKPVVESKLVELSSTSSGDDDLQLIADLQKKKQIIQKLEDGDNLTKKERFFLENFDETKPWDSQKSKKKAKRRRKNNSSSSSDNTSDSEAEIERKRKRKERREKKRLRRQEKAENRAAKNDSSKGKNCQICLIEKCKYRCPACRILYCNTKFDFSCFREHKDDGTCQQRIEEGKHIKPLTKEDRMDIQEKLALALKNRRKLRKQVKTF